MVSFWARSVRRNRPGDDFTRSPKKHRIEISNEEILCRLLDLNVASERNIQFLTRRFQSITKHHDRNEMDLGQNVFAHDKCDYFLELLGGISLSIFKSSSINGRIWTMPLVFKRPCTSSFTNISPFFRMRRQVLLFIRTKNWKLMPQNRTSFLKVFSFPRILMNLSAS